MPTMLEVHDLVHRYGGGPDAHVAVSVRPAAASRRCCAASPG
jgi:hypothetical protein